MSSSSSSSTTASAVASSNSRYTILETKSAMETFEMKYKIQSNTNKPFLIASFRDWCGACQRIKPIWESDILPKILSDSDMNIYQVNTDPEDLGGSLAASILSSAPYVPAFVKSRRTEKGDFVNTTHETLPITRESILEFVLGPH